jgi:hypothetical protein
MNISCGLVSENQEKGGRVLLVSLRIQLPICTKIGWTPESVELNPSLHEYIRLT